MVGAWLLVIGLALRGGVEGALTAGSVAAGDCVCGDTNTQINARDHPGLSGNIVAKIQNGQCLKIHSASTSVSDGYTWFSLDLSGQVVYAAGDYFNKASAASCGSGSSGGCPPIVGRSGWGARAATSISYQSHPAQYAIIHHTAGADCHDLQACITQVQLTQNYHMDGRGYSDIGYSFMIGGEGSIFEGRGWDHLGAHTLNYNSIGFGFCFIGNFMDHAPSSIQISRAQQLIACGVSLGKLSSAYILKGHRDVGSTACPGDVFYPMVQQWPHYQ